MANVAPSPNSKQHKRLISLVRDRKSFGQRYFTQRYDRWREAERNYRGYVVPDVKKDDNVPWMRKLFVPITPLLIQTQLSFDVASFTQRTPVVSLEGVGPEDVKRSKLVEAMLEWEWRKRRMVIELFGWLQDRRRYGIGILWNRYTQDIGWRRDRTPRKVELPLFGIELEMPPTNERVEFLRYEGNDPEVVDPFRFGFDPRVSAARVQHGEFVYRMVRKSFSELLEQEATGFYTNVEAIPRGKKGNQGSSLLQTPDSITFEDTDGESDRERILGTESGDNDRSSGALLNSKLARVDDKDDGFIDITEMIVRLRPRQYEIGEGDKPELWWVTMANDATIIRAEPFDFDHQQFPVAIIESNPDPHSTLNISSVEELKELQSFANWMYRSHAEHVVRTLNGQYVVDPSKVNLQDILNPGPGGLIRLKEDAFGMPGGMDDAIKQLQVQDVTRGHLGEIQNILGFLEKLSAASETLQGQVSGSETATEQTLAFQGATGRLKTQAQIAWNQGMIPWVDQRIANIQQLMSEERFVRIFSGVADALDVPPEDRFVRVNPQDIQGEFDIQTIDGIVRGDGQMLQAFTQVFTQVVNSPELAARFDVGAMMKFWAYLAGVRNLSDFTNKEPVAGIGNPNDPVQAVEEEEVERQVQAGNLAPASEVLGGGG